MPITVCELSYATYTRINVVGTKVQFAFAVPVSGLIPDLKRSDGSFPQASCQLSLVSPVNRELKRRVPVECSNRSKMEKVFRHNFLSIYTKLDGGNFCS